jgi:hypothetical protein
MLVVTYSDPNQTLRYAPTNRIRKTHLRNALSWLTIESEERPIGKHHCKLQSDFFEQLTLRVKGAVL